MITINLLPWRQNQKERLIKAFNIWMGTSAFIACMIGGGIYVYSLAKITDATEAQDILKREIADCEKKIIKINKYKEIKTALVERMKVVQTLQSTRILTIHLLDELIKITPEGIFLTSIQRVGDQVTIHGDAESNTEVSALMRNIENNAWIFEPKLTEIKRSKSDDTRGGTPSTLQPNTGSEFQLSFIVKSKKLDTPGPSAQPKPKQPGGPHP